MRGYRTGGAEALKEKAFPAMALWSNYKLDLAR